MGKKIAIFGGTFDPVHIGHVALVVAMQEKHHLDSVLIIPANRSPHKGARIPVEAKHRLNMLRRAFKDLPYCTILPIELERAGPSYTIYTICELSKRHIVTARDRLYLILGQDLLESFHKWKNPEAIMECAKALVARRAEFIASPKESQIQKWLKEGLTDTPYFEISSTDIRQRLKHERYCGHLLNNSVYNYIKRHNLYE